jgi:hypothetical protein
MVGAVLACALAGCNSSTTSTTPATPAPALANVAGQYRGTVSDSAFGAGKALGDFSQSGASVGGRLQLTYASQKILNSVALTLKKSGSIAGSATATIGNAACTFAVTATYDSTTFRLTGNYSASTGCSGQSGSFAMREICSYPPGTLPADRRALRHAAARPNAGGLHGC